MKNESLQFPDLLDRLTLHETRWDHDKFLQLIHEKLAFETNFTFFIFIILAMCFQIMLYFFQNNLTALLFLLEVIMNQYIFHQEFLWATQFNVRNRLKTKKKWESGGNRLTWTSLAYLFPNFRLIFPISSNFSNFQIPTRDRMQIRIFPVIHAPIYIEPIDWFVTSFPR